MDFYPKPRIVSLDIDGILVKSKLVKFDRKYLEWISINAPTLKKIILEIVELTERILPIKHELTNLRLEETSYLYQAAKNSDYVIITTDRSAFGINTIMKRLSGFEDIIRFSSHVQVRKSIFNLERLSKGKMSESKVIKPDPEVLDFLQTFARKRMIKPEEILIADDSPYFRKVAKEFGFQIFPNDIITTRINKTELEKVPYAPLLPS